MTALRDQANAAAQQALHDMHEYVAKHGHRSSLLDDAYSAAERVMDAVEEYERLSEAAEVVRFLQDPGDHHVYPAGVA